VTVEHSALLIHEGNDPMPTVKMEADKTLVTAMGDEWWEPGKAFITDVYELHLHPDARDDVRVLMAEAMDDEYRKLYDAHGFSCPMFGVAPSPS